MIQTENHRKKQPTVNVQVKTEAVSACYIEVIEDLIDFLIEKGDESTPTNEVLRRIQLLRMMKKDIEKLSNP